MWACSRFRCLVLSSFFISFSFSFSTFPSFLPYPFYPSPIPLHPQLSFSFLFLYSLPSYFIHSLDFNYTLYTDAPPHLDYLSPKLQVHISNLLHLLICMPGNILKVNTFKRKGSLHVSLQLPTIMSFLILLVPQMARLAQP